MPDVARQTSGRFRTPLLMLTLLLRDRDLGPGGWECMRRRQPVLTLQQPSLDEAIPAFLQATPWRLSEGQEWEPTPT